MTGRNPSDEEQPLRADIARLQAQLADALTRQVGVGEDQLLSAVFQASPAAIGTATGREITMVNARFTEMLGYTVEESIGQSTRFVYPDDKEYQRVGKLLYQPLHDKPSFAVSATLQRKDGGLIRTMICAAPLVPGKPEAGITFVLLDITHAEGLAESLRERTAQLEAAQQLANLGSWSYDLASGAISWSDHLFALFGRDPAEGVPTLDEHCRYIHPDDLTRTMDTFSNAIDRGQGYEVEYRVVHPDGQIRHLKTIAAIEEDRTGQVLRLFGTTQDVTDQKHAQQALEQSEQRYRRLFNAGNDAVFVHGLSEDGDLLPFTDVNDAACNMTGYSREELMSMTPADIDLDQAGKLTEIGNHLIANGQETVRSIHTRKDGKTYHAEVSATAFRADGQWQVLSAVRDISERVKIQDQIQQTQKLESLGVLAGGIAHDFNNLLMGIMGNADLALMELSKVSPARENVEEIKTASARAADLCRQMLAYSGKGRFVIEPINLSEIVEEMSHMLEVSISKSVVLKYNFGENLPATRVDITQIRQVIMNLITNASEAIGDRSGVISITTGAMNCDTEYLDETYLEDDLAPGLYLTLEVADTGGGMDHETIQRIFEPFFTTKFTGRGLGLAAVLGIVRGHKGAIKIYSEPGQGTTVRLLLPACEETSTSPDNDSSNAPPCTLPLGTVLLADDEETVRAVGKRMLERIGAEVLLASDGRQAVEQYQAHKDRVSAVILDLTMPTMDGQEAHRQLRKIDPDVRVLVSSGYNEQEVAQRFIGRGLAGFIQKPYQIETLREALHQALHVPPETPSA